MLSEPVVALWVQGVFLGAAAALQGKQWQLEGTLHVCVWHRANTPAPLLTHPSVMGHASCRCKESIICGELRCLIVDGGGSTQLGMRQTHEKTAAREMELGWQRGRTGKTLGCYPTGVPLARKLVGFSAPQSAASCP